MTPSKSLGMHRLPSALSMFKGLLHLPEEIQKELDWLAAELGMHGTGTCCPGLPCRWSRRTRRGHRKLKVFNRRLLTGRSSTTSRHPQSQLPPLHPSHAQHDALGASWAGVRTRKQWRQWATSWCSQSKSLPEKF